MITETNLFVFFLGLVVSWAGFTDRISVLIPIFGGSKIVGTVGGIIAVAAALNMLGVI